MIKSIRGNRFSVTQKLIALSALGALVLAVASPNIAGAATKITTQTTNASSYIYTANLGSKYAKKSGVATLSTVTKGKTTKISLGTYIADSKGQFVIKSATKLNSTSTLTLTVKGLKTYSTSVSKLILAAENKVTPDLNPSVDPSTTSAKGPFTYTLKLTNAYVNKSAAITFTNVVNSKTVTTKLGNATVDANGVVTITSATKLDSKGKINVNVWGFTPYVVPVTKLTTIVTPVVQPIVPVATPTPTPTPTSTTTTTTTPVAPTTPTIVAVNLEDGLVPTFSTLTATNDGYTFKITNFSPLYTWTGVDGNHGTVSISIDGNVSVTKLPSGLRTQMVVTSSRSGYKDASATTPDIVTGLAIGGGGGGGGGGGTGGGGGSTSTTYTINYVYNGATGGNTRVTDSFTTGGTALTLPSPTLTGNTFNGWFADSGLSVLVGAAGGSYTPSGTITSLSLYAKWTSTSGTFTVTYDGNGGTGSTVDSGSYTNGSPVTVQANNYVNTNGTFINWNSARNGSGQWYVPGSTFNISANTVLYAQWNLPAQTISFLQPVPMRENTVQVLEAAATSGLPVTYTSVTPAICTVINGARQNYINAIAAGSCVIEAAQLGNSSITAANPIQQTLQVLATNDSRVILVIDPNGGSFTVNRITYFSAYGTVVNSGTVFTLPQKSPAATALSNTAYNNVVWTVGDINGAVAPTSYTVTADTIVVAKWS